MKKNTVLQAGVWNTIANFVLKGISFVTTFIFANLLNTAEYGVVSTFFTYVSIFTLFVGLNLHSTIMIARIDYEKDYNQYLSSIITLALIAGMIVLGGSLFFKGPLESFLEIDIFKIILLIIIAFCQFAVEYKQMINAADFKYKNNLFLSFAVSLGNIVFSLLFICIFLKEQKVFGRILGAYLVVIILGIIIIAGILMQGKTFIKTEYWKYGLKLSLPNLIHSVSNLAMSQFDRIAIKKLVDDSAVGLYSLISNFGLIVQILWNSINTVWVPWLYRQLKEENKENIIQKSNWYIAGFSILTVMCQAVLPDFVRLCPPEYHSSASLVFPIILGGYFIFLYSFPVNLQFYYKKNKYIAAGTTLAAIINIVTNLIFIPIWGYQAAAYTTLVAYVFLFVFHWILVTYIHKINFYQLKTFIVSIVLVCSVSLIFMVIRDMLILKYSIVFIFCILMIIWIVKNRQMLLELIGREKKK